MTDAWLETRAKLHGFILRRVGDSPVADGILQETLLRFLEAREGIRAQEALTGWMYRVASNLIADHFRKERRHGALDDEHPAPEEPEDPHRELAGCLRPLLATLPEGYRTALELADLEELPHKEVAVRLGLGVSGVKSRVQRGRVLLLEALERCCVLEKGPTGVSGYEPRARGCSGCSAPDGG
ncbi:MAG: hypothetical protein RL318_2248 [Fibrobacterota bacterium]|jgi:RNA polymerase sigma-70 factor (ECF subfamily)